jgi:tRNA(Met) C34 N-acetyltransferase TmcA
MPPAAEYFVGTVDGELVAHLAVAPFFTAGAYRATRLVVMPEWQGAGVGTKFLEWVCQYHKEGRGRCGRQMPVLFHTSHPQLVGYLKNSPKWVLKSQQLFGAVKSKSAASMMRANLRRNSGPLLSCSGKVAATMKPTNIQAGYGGHFRAVQGFKYIGEK